MRTSFFEADPFSGSKGDHYLTIETDYRFEKNDEVWLDLEGRRIRVRVTWIVVSVTSDGDISREILAMKL